MAQHLSTSFGIALQLLICRLCGYNIAVLLKGSRLLFTPFSHCLPCSRFIHAREQPALASLSFRAEVPRQMEEVHELKNRLGDEEQGSAADEIASLSFEVSLQPALSDQTPRQQL